MAETAKVLVVANRTARSPELLGALRERRSRGAFEFTLLVPQTAHGLAWAANPDSAHDEAEEQRKAFLDGLRDEGVEVADAKVGDADPLAAIQDECNFGNYHEVIVSTLPLRASKWLRLDLPSKARAAPGLPVTHIEAGES